MHELFNINDDNGSKGKKLRFVKHANNKIAAKFIVMIWWFIHHSLILLLRIHSVIEFSLFILYCSNQNQIKNHFIAQVIYKYRTIYQI